MKKNKLLYMYIYIIFISTAQSMMVVNPQEIDADRNANYSIVATPTVLYNNYEITASTENLIITHSKNSTSIMIVTVISSNIDYKTQHGIFIKTFDAQGTLLENSTILINIIDLTNEEIKELQSDLKIVSDNLDDVVEEYNESKSNWTNFEWPQPEPSLGEQYGSEIIVGFIMVSLTSGAVIMSFIPRDSSQKSMRKKQEKLKNKEREKRKKEETNQRLTSFSMKGYKDEKRGKETEKGHILNQYERQIIYEIDSRMDWLYYIDVEEYNKENKEKVTKSIQVCKARIKKVNPTLDKWLAWSGIVEYMTYKGYTNPNNSLLVGSKLKDFEKQLGKADKKFREETTGLEDEKQKFDDIRQRIVKLKEKRDETKGTVTRSVEIINNTPPDEFIMPKFR